MRLSNALAESCRAGGGASARRRPDALDRLREGGPGQPELDELVRDLADRIAPDARFASIDYDLVQALLYLQAPSPRIKACVLKYLRCEDLTPHDRRDLGGIVPRVYASAPQWMIQRLGELMWAVEKVPLVLCVDQLEDMFDLGDAPARFRRVLATLCDIISRLPSAIVVISCLENFFDEVKRHLTQPISRRVTAGPGPVELPAACDRDQVVALIGRRLESLYRSTGVRFRSRPSRRIRSPTPWCAGSSAWARATSSTRSSATASVASRKGRWSSTLLTTAAARPPAAVAGARPQDRRDRAGVERGPLDDGDRGPVRRGRAGGDPGRGDRLVHRRARRGRRRISRRRRTAASSRPSATAPATRSSGSWWASATRDRRGAAWAGRSTRSSSAPAGSRRSIVRSTAFPASAKAAVVAAAQQADRRRRPPRGRRGLGLADHDGPVALPHGPRAGPGLRRLARADPPLDQPRGVAGDPGPGSAPSRPPTGDEG